jgi:hypothetical protein
MCPWFETVFAGVRPEESPRPAIGSARKSGANVAEGPESQAKAPLGDKVK